MVEGVVECMYSRPIPVNASTAVYNVYMGITHTRVINNRRVTTPQPSSGPHSPPPPAHPDESIAIII